jgi:hypothetical protein
MFWTSGLILRSVVLVGRVVMNKKYVVKLTKDERGRLRKLISEGESLERMLNRARILLKADQGEHTEGLALINRQIA